MKTKLISTILLLVMSAAGVFGDVLRVGSGSPYSTITSALATAKAGDEIWVSAGTYREAELIIPPGVSVYGGFTGSESKLTERNYTANATILDGSGIHRVATVSGLLDGFTLRNGRTGDNGGGVLIKSGGTVSHCIAFANEAGYDGGAVFAEEGSTVKNTLLTGNRAGNDGAALSGQTGLGYQAVNLTVAGNDFTYKPEIKTEITVPASLTAGERLDVAEPDITNPDEVEPNGSTILVKGWELDGHSIHMPYTVTYADNGKKLRFWAANAAGVGVSNEATLTVTWTVSSDVRLLTPRAVCEGTTLAGAGITTPDFSPAPADGATYVWYIDGTPVSGLDYALQYTDNGRLLTCEVRNSNGSITGATTPAVRLAVMKAPEILFESKASLSIGDGEPLCLPTPVVLSNGSDLTAQGWKWTTDGGATSTDFNSCDKAAAAMNGATVYYTAENACTAGTPVTKDYITALTVTNPVGEFLQTAPALCEGMTLGDGISFNDGDNRGDYYIGNTYLSVNGSTPGSFSTLWDDAKATPLATAHNLQVLRFSYNGGKSERRLTLTVHAVPVLTDIPAGEQAQVICENTDLSVGVTASGSGVSYEWQRSTNGGTSFTSTGETGSRLRTSITGDALYRCVVKATCMDKATAGTPAYDAALGGIPSSAVGVTLAKKPSVLPADGFTPAAFAKCEGESIGLTDADISVEDNNKAVAASARWWTLGGLQVAGDYAVAPDDNGKTVGYCATNECGTTAVTFAAMKLRVDEKPRVTEDPADVTATEDTPVRLRVSASGSGLTYQWQKKAHGADATAWTDIDATAEPTAATAAYSFTAANITSGAFDGADVLTDYRCMVGTTNACNSTTVPSAAATVTVTRLTSPVTIRRQPSSYEVCNSSAAYSPGFTVEVAGSGHFIYNWYNINDPATAVRTEPATGSTAATTDTYIPSKGDDAAGTYYCVVTSTDDGMGVQSQAATLTVSRAPEIKSITPASAKICEGGSVTLGVDAGGSALTYQWYQQAGLNQDPATDTKKGTAATYTPVGLTSTARFYCIAGSGSVCTGTDASATVEVTVEKAPKITTQPVSQAVCGGTGITLEVEAENTDHYQWYYNGAVTGTNNSLLPNVTKGGVYTCVVSMTGGVCGEVTSVPALITAAGKPTVNLGTRDALTACKGDLVTLPSPEVETGGSVIVPERTGWYLSTDAAKKLVSSFIAGDNNVTYNYMLTYKCSADATVGDEKTLTTTEGAMPTLTISVTAAPTVAGSLKDVTKNVGEKVKIAEIVTGFTSSGGTAQWQLGGTLVTFGTDGYKVSAADHEKQFSCVVTNACGAQKSLAHPTLGKLTVNSLEITDQPASQTVCAGASVTLSVKATNATGYKWLRDGAAVSGATGSTLNLSNITSDKAGVYTCEVSGAGGLKLVSSPAVVTVNAKPQIVSNSQNVTVCKGSAVTLQVEAKGYDLQYSWNQNIASTSSAVTVTPTATTTYTCTVKNSCDPTGKTASITVTVPAAPAKPTFTTGSSGPNTCEGTVVPLPAVSGKAANGYWKLNNVPKGNIDKYTVHSADNGQKFTYVNVDACGQENESTETYTLQVQQPARITEVISASPVYFKMGAALNTKITTAPKASNATLSKWKLNDATVALDKTVALSDDAARLTYCVDNGCPAVGQGGIDETSTVVRVWAKPTFTGDNTVTTMAGMVGHVYPYPAVPTVAMNNCTLVSQGWIKEGAGTNADNYLSLAALAKMDDDGTKVAYRVKYSSPDGTETGLYSDSKAVGVMRPWNVPSIADNTGTVYAKQGANWVLPTVEVAPNNTKLETQSWVYGLNDGKGFTALPAQADFASQTGKKLYRQVTYTIPGGYGPYIINIECGDLFPWREPVMDAYTAVKWDHMCDTKSYKDNGWPLNDGKIGYELNECSLVKEYWTVGSENKEITSDSKPDIKDDGKEVKYNLTWKAPDGSGQYTITKVRAKLETYTVPKLTITEAAAGSANVQVIGAYLNDTYTLKIEEPKYGEYTHDTNWKFQLIAGHHNQTYYETAHNACGEGRAEIKVNLETTDRGKRYYNGITGNFEALYTGVSATCFGDGRDLYAACVETMGEIAKRRGAGWKNYLVNLKNYTEILNMLTESGLWGQASGMAWRVDEIRIMVWNGGLDYEGELHVVGTYFETQEETIRTTRLVDLLGGIY